LEKGDGIVLVFFSGLFRHRRRVRRAMIDRACVRRATTLQIAAVPLQREDWTSISVAAFRPIPSTRRRTKQQKDGKKSVFFDIGSINTRRFMVVAVVVDSARTGDDGGGVFADDLELTLADSTHTLQSTCLTRGSGNNGKNDQ